MALKIYKPTSPGRRQMTVSTFSELKKAQGYKARKSLTKSKMNVNGRNNQGRITIRHRGGGAKRNYRVVDFSRREKMNIPGVLKSIEYDPNRNVRIGLVYYQDGDKRYILIPQKIQVGFKIMTAEKTTPQPGNRMLLKNIPEGLDIYNLEIKPKKGGQLVRSAGMSAKLVSLEGKYAQVKLPSGEIRFLHKDCMATIGMLGNSEFSNIKIGKAGRSRLMGKRPQVRGKAMNPCDHPHGGGEGGNPIGLKHPKTPWGKPALGLKTRNRKKYSKKMIVRSRHNK